MTVQAGLCGTWSGAQIAGFLMQRIMLFQELTFSGFTAETATYEVQTIEIQSEGSFRFGLFDVYTEPLTKSASETMVADAINALPVWGTEEPVKESVTVVRLPQTSDEITTYQITFGSKRGEFMTYFILNNLHTTIFTTISG